MVIYFCLFHYHFQFFLKTFRITESERRKITFQRGVGWMSSTIPLECVSLSNFYCFSTSIPIPIPIPNPSSAQTAIMRFVLFCIHVSIFHVPCSVYHVPCFKTQTYLNVRESSFFTFNAVKAYIASIDNYQNHFLQLTYQNKSEIYYLLLKI